MKQSSFFAMVLRMKHINRWSLMRNTRYENLSEHSLEVAVIAHALAVIRNVRFGGAADAERAALLGAYHDVPEILTGDLPTPVKYANGELRSAYRKVEETAAERFVSMLPEDLQSAYQPLFAPQDSDRELWQLVKTADKLSALLKCIEERNMGNGEFKNAEASTRRILKELSCPEADVFMKEFLPAFEMTLDQQAGDSDPAESL